MSSPKLTATCNCTPCREGFSNFCETEYPGEISHQHDFGAPTNLENYRLELVLQTLLGGDKWLCPCLIGERYDELLLQYGYTIKEDIADEVREQFIKYYKDCTGLEACEEDECEYPDGLSPEDCVGDFDYGQYMIDQQQAYWDGINEERFSSKF
jgi:hypothetical protein